MAETAPSPSRHDRRRERTRVALIDAARAVFAERGTEAATIQEITDTADVAKGSFYNHFDSRADVLRAVVEATLDRLGAALDCSLAGSQEDPARVLAHSLYASIRACVDDPVVGGFVLRTERVIDVAEAALGERGRRDILVGIRSGRFRAADLELTVAAIAGAAEAVIEKRLRGELTERAEIGLVALVLGLLGVPEEQARTLADDAARAHGAERPR
jgi:AcrR family transcriptional regulator